MRHNVEAEFLRALYLGESVAPFRLLEPIKAVVPWDRESGQPLDSSEAQRKGFTYLAGWLAEAERLWEQHGKGSRSLTQQLDYYGQLSAQFPTAPIRVLYAASGTLPAAAILRSLSSLVEHKLYWSSVESEEEGRYLMAVLNSETTRSMTEHLQSRGQWGARDFDKVMLSLPIPRYSASNALHQELARAAAHAEEVAAAVSLKEETHFVTARRLIRRALQENGVAGHMERLVAELLAPAPKTTGTDHG